LDFVFDAKKGSHEQCVLIKNNRTYKVTVDCPFSQELIKSMAAQAGCTKKNFYKIRKNISSKSCHERGFIDWSSGL